MDPAAVLAILKQLPKPQRDAARKRIDTALGYGWDEIRLDIPDVWPADAAYLSGIHPGGRRQLLPEIE